MPSKIAQIDGILNIDKPYGITSMDVVRRIKRASRQRRVGHGGTLDPVATGVIPICMGQATRMMEYLVDGTKKYRAVIELGTTTDTYDALGQVTSKGDYSEVTLDGIKNALGPFHGAIQQVPPMYSALKQQGKRLYELARAGIEVERKPRSVEVYGIDLLEWSSPLLTLEVTCGRGFYMRSLAYDLGQVLGCGGHLKSLVRLRSGGLHICRAIDLSEMEKKFEDGSWLDEVHPLDRALYKMRAGVVSHRVENMIKNGRMLTPGLRIPVAKPDEKCRVYSVDGRFLAVIKFDATTNAWRPDKVFSSSNAHTGNSV